MKSKGISRFVVDGRGEIRGGDCDTQIQEIDFFLAQSLSQKEINGKGGYVSV